jgi:DNA polymerase III epsilon subunit-like protein
MDSLLTRALALIEGGRPLLVIDTETTGLRPPRGSGEPEPRIYQIAALRREPSGETRFHSRLLNPGVAVEAEWAAARGFDPEAPMRDGEESGPVLRRFAAWATGCVIIGHNIEAFDLPVMVAEHARLGLPAPIAYLPRAGTTVDTIVLARSLWPARATDRPVDHTIANVARYIGLEVDEAALHDAGADVRLNLAVLDALHATLRERAAV